MLNDVTASEYKRLFVRFAVDSHSIFRFLRNYKIVNTAWELESPTQPFQFYNYLYGVITIESEGIIRLHIK